MFRMGSTGVGFRVNRLYAHQSHQTLDPFAVDLTALPAEMPGHRAAAVCRCFQVLLVDEAHQLQILDFNRLWLVVKRGPVEAQQLTLAGNARLASFRFDHLLFFFGAHEPSFRAKKSFSTFSWPICR